MTERLTRVPRMQEVISSNSRPAKTYTALQTVRQHFNSVVLTLCRGDGYRKLVTRFGAIWPRAQPGKGLKHLP